MQKPKHVQVHASELRIGRLLRFQNSTAKQLFAGNAIKTPIVF